MAINISVYTNTDAIRSSMGVDDVEIPDEKMSALHLEEELLLDLSIWLPNAQQIFDDAEFSAVPTLDQIQKGRTLKLFSQWFCAARALSIWLYYPQRISDGVQDMRRFSNLDLDELAKNAEKTANKYKGILLGLEGTPIQFHALLGKASPNYDPVTGNCSE